MALSKERTRKLDWATALDQELSARNSLLPSRIADVAALANRDSALRVISGRHTRGTAVAEAEVVVASKSTRGFRPVAVLPLADRVLYRALVNAFSPPLPVPDRSDEAFAAFNAAPLEDPKAAYIARADVAAYYQYVDHGALEGELVAQTGDAELAEALSEFLSGVMDRRVGLPQNNEASHIVADVYIDMVERELLRGGHVVWRYNDDFHFAAPTLRSARLGLESLEAALRRVGLTPSDEKSMILSRDRYADWVEAPARRRAQINDAIEVDFDAWILLPSDYGVDDDDEELDDVEGLSEVVPDDEGQVEGALRALELWWTYLADNAVRDPLDLYVNRQLARDAIRLLRRRGSDRGVPFCGRLIAFQPELTHTVSRYLRTLTIYGEPSSVAFVEELVLNADHLSAWQCLWLLEPLWRTAQVPGALTEWVSALAHSERSPDALSARAAFVLAVHQQIGADELGAIFSRVREASRPDVVAAVAWLADSSEDRKLRAFKRESPLYGFVADFILARRAAS